MLSKLLSLFTGGGSGQPRVRKIDQDYDVSGQLKPQQLPEIARMGYKMLICMRPDNEGLGQPSFAEMASAAAPLGVETVYFPVTPGSLTEGDARRLKKILAKRKGPVLAYCASGNRATMAYGMARRA